MRKFSATVALLILLCPPAMFALADGAADAPEDGSAICYALSGASYEDAARVLGKNKKQIDNLIYRAKTVLKKILTEEESGDAQ